MDILKRSNIERIMYDKFGASRTKELMEDLANDNKFVLTSQEVASLQEDFIASYSDDSLCEAEIAKYANKGYIMDPHTATCIKAYETLREKDLPCVIYSTAEWTKFSPTVAKSLGEDIPNDLEALEYVSKSADVSVPSMVKGLFSKPIIHTVVVEKEDIKKEMLNFL
jgi:threonine synthase